MPFFLYSDKINANVPLCLLIYPLLQQTLYSVNITLVATTVTPVTAPDDVMKTTCIIILINCLEDNLNKR